MTSTEVEDVKIKSSPKKEMFWDAVEISKIDGFWYSGSIAASMKSFRANFELKRDGGGSGGGIVTLASFPKTGTTWLKALAHCVLFRDEQGEDDDDMLAKLNPHHCVPTFEIPGYFDRESLPRVHSDRPQLFHTHLPYSSLPDSIKSSDDNNIIKLVYIARDPKDTLVSRWHYTNKILTRENGDFPLDRAVESFCTGKIPFGPYWDHMLEYWEESKRSPDKVMFIKYENLRSDPKMHVRKLASFMGNPFGEGDDDDEEGVEKVIWRSSFDRLKELEVNKTGYQHDPVLAPNLKNSHLFRRGEVGDWRNYLTPEMAERIDNVMVIKLKGTGLHF